MVIAIQGHIAEYDCEGWLDPDASQAERDRRVPRVEELTARPLTLTVITDLLTAIAR